MESAEHHRNACRTIAIGESIGLVDLRRERRDADEIERLQFRLGIEVLNLTVGDLAVVGGERRHREQAEAG